MDDPEATDEYAALLEESKSQTYEDFEALDVLYVSGHDPVGRPIVVFIANRLPAKTVDLDKFASSSLMVLYQTTTYSCTSEQTPHQPTGRLWRGYVERTRCLVAITKSTFKSSI